MIQAFTANAPTTLKLNIDLLHVTPAFWQFLNETELYFSDCARCAPPQMSTRSRGNGLKNIDLKTSGPVLHYLMHCGPNGERFESLETKSC